MQFFFHSHNRIKHGALMMGWMSCVCNFAICLHSSVKKIIDILNGGVNRHTHSS